MSEKKHSYDVDEKYWMTDITCDHKRYYFTSCKIRGNDTPGLFHISVGPSVCASVRKTRA